MLRASLPSAGTSALTPAHRSLRARRLPEHLLACEVERPLPSPSASSSSLSAFASSPVRFVDGTGSSSSVPGVHQVVHRAGRSGSPHSQRNTTHNLSHIRLSTTSHPASPLVEQDAESEAAWQRYSQSTDALPLSASFCFKRRRLNLPSCAVSDVPSSSPLPSSAPSDPLATPTLLPHPSPPFLHSSPSFALGPLHFDDLDGECFDDAPAAVIRHSSEPSSPASVAESSYSFYSTSTHTSASTMLSSSSPTPLPRSVCAARGVGEERSDGLHRCPVPDTATGLLFHDRVHGRSMYHHPGPSVSREEAVDRVFAATAFVVYSTLLHPKDVLRKWSDLESAWDGFDVRKVARYGPADVKRLLEGKKLIKDRVKVTAIIHNACVIDAMERRLPGAFLQLLWAPHTQPEQPFPVSERVLPLSPVSYSPSDALACVDFSCKPTTSTVADGVTATASIYALKAALQSAKLKRMAHDGCLLFAQMVGLVNHHQRGCFAWAQCEDEYQQVLTTRMAASP